MSNDREPRLLSALFGLGADIGVQALPYLLLGGAGVAFVSGRSLLAKILCGTFVLYIVTVFVWILFRAVATPREARRDWKSMSGREKLLFGPLALVAMLMLTGLIVLLVVLNVIERQ